MLIRIHTLTVAVTPVRCMLTFVGLGLYDERSITIRGREAIAAADRIVAEEYTSRLVGTDLDNLAEYHDTEIEALDRDGVEIDPSDILDDAATRSVVFLTGGDPMISTTHVDLRLRAIDRGIETDIVHGASVATAAPGLAGLQNYRFGKATTVPFPGTFGDDGPPASVIDTIAENRSRGLHTLVYLDLDEAGARALSASTAAEMLSAELGDNLGVVVARAGSDAPLVTADSLHALAKDSFGPPLHVLIIPGRLHPIEADALRTLADAPEDLVAAHAAE